MLVRKKAVQIEAFNWDGSEESAQVIINWALSYGTEILYSEDIDPDASDAGMGLGTYHLTIKTLEGWMVAKPGYWIIKGVEDEFYGCEPNIFAKTYEMLEDIEARTLRVLLAHEAQPLNSSNCMCGWRPTMSLNDINSDRQQHRAHVAAVMARFIEQEPPEDLYPEHYRHCHIRVGYLCTCGASRKS